MIEIYGVDTEGMEGVLIRFSAVLEANTKGISMIGLVGGVVSEGCQRAVKAINTIDGNWSMSNFKITIQLSPSETQKHSAGLDLPIAVTLLTGSLLMDEEKIDQCIEELQQGAEKDAGKKKTKNNQALMLRQSNQLSDHKSKIEKYRKKIRSYAVGKNQLIYKDE